MNITLWRAANDDYISQGYSFAESRDIAELYLDNPGFGGDKLWQAVVQFKRSQAIDLTDASTSEVAARLHMHDPGAIGLDEWLPRDQDAIDKLREDGFLWALVRESYPEGSTTWVWLGTFYDDEPELRPVEVTVRPNGYSDEELDEALERLDELIGKLDFSFVQEGDDLSFRKPKAMGYHYTSKRNLEAIEREGLGGRVSFEPHEFAFWLALPYIAPEDAASVLIDAERDRERSRSWSPGDPSQKTLDKLQALLDKVDDLHVVWFYREPGFAGSTAGRRETCVKFNLNDVGDWLSSHAESVHEFTDHADGYAVAWIGPQIPPQFLEDCGEDF